MVRRHAHTAAIPRPRRDALLESQGRAVPLREPQVRGDRAVGKEVAGGRFGEAPPVGIEMEERQPGPQRVRVEELVLERMLARAAQ